MEKTKQLRAALKLPEDLTGGARAPCSCLFQRSKPFADGHSSYTLAELPRSGQREGAASRVAEHPEPLEPELIGRALDVIGPVESAPARQWI
jgi:hypothetical protein